MTTEIDLQTDAGLRGAAEGMIAGAAKNLTQLLGQDVEFTLEGLTVEPTAVPETVEQGLHLSVDFEGALTGDSWFVLAEDDAKGIVKMMTQGMGVEEDDLLGELGMSALSEAMNQMMAGAATALSDGLGERIDISPPTITRSNEPQPVRDDVIVAVYSGQVAGSMNSKVYWQIDKDLAASLGSAWPVAAPEPEPAAEPTASAAPPAAAAPAPVPAAAPAAAIASAAGAGVIDSVELDVAVELGNVALTIGELLRLGEGSVVALNQTVGENVVMLANGTPVASGEVVVVEGTLGFRVSALITEAKGA